jgi:excisionase family DNA binding protein
MENEAPVVPATVGEAARIAEQSEDFIRQKVDSGEIAAMRTRSGMRLIDRRSLDEFLRRRAERRAHKA